jgi:glycine cleavage system H protein
MSSVPEDLRYTAEHEWVRKLGDDVVRFGITDFAQDALGDIVFVTLPGVGTQVTAGSTCGEVESTKSVSDIYAPVTGEVVARNDAVETAPETINSEPYDAGWIAEVRLADPSDLSGLMTSAQYQDLIASGD